MTGIFKANNPYNNFLLFVYGFILKLPLFIHPGIPEAKPADGILYKLFLKWLIPAGLAMPAIYGLIAFLFLYIQAIGITKLLNDHRLMPKLNYLAGMSYLLITSAFTEWHILSAALIINTLLIWILSALCHIYNSPAPKTTIFNIGMVTGLASLIYFPSIAFSLLIIVGLTITRPFRLQEWIIAFAGIITPYYFLAAWIFLTGNWKSFHFPVVSIALPRLHESVWSSIAIILVLFIVSMGISFIQKNIRRLLVQSRKSWSLIYLYMAVSFFIPFLNGGKDLSDWILVAVPAAAFAAAAFLFPEKKWFSISMHWSLVALSVVTGYFLR